MSAVISSSDRFSFYNFLESDLPHRLFSFLRVFFHPSNMLSAWVSLYVIVFLLAEFNFLGSPSVHPPIRQIKFPANISCHTVCIPCTMNSTKVQNPRRNS